MRYLALACDYDGTLARHGCFDDATRTVLAQLKATGRKLILVTGRRIDDLEQACPDLSIFDCVVGENGAVLYAPATRETRALVEPPPPAFAETLKKRGVPEVACGRVIVATWQPYETVVLQVIRDLQLEMQVIFNKGAVMVLPSGVNKGSGLMAALEELRLSPHNVVAVGDAENDHALLAGCECGVAVANALPMLKQRADLVTAGEAGAGVAELALRMIRDDLADLEPTLTRHDLPIGADQGNQPVILPPYGATVLLAGTSGSGKSTFATAFLEGLSKHG
ncbi:MAG TPA: HAD-IIB family hydrolase, partial [Polyangia bacterium]|nr:HAD-IIB family hydrolase [Polyangia bacterium]